MRKITAYLPCIILAFLASKSFALPPCPSSGVWNNCYGEHTFASGEKYAGEWRDDKVHGKGTYTWPNGEKYAGEWRDGRKHGKGIVTYASGDKYVGEFHDNMRHGLGTYTFVNGNKYVGEWRNSATYEGIEYNASGAVRGTFSNGQWCEGCTPTSSQLAVVEQINSSLGRSTSSQSSSSSSDSSSSSTTDALPSCPSSMRHESWNNCYGTSRLDNYNEWAGEWRDGMPYGKGTLTKYNGDTYVGTVRNFKEHGQGTYTWRSDGRSYVGEFMDGKRHGQGTLTWPDGWMTVGGKYVGEWRDDKKHGQGTLTWNNGDKYVGEWRDDEKHGQGTLTWTDGRRYVGEWNAQRGVKGKGTYIWANGTKYVGEWRSEKPYEGIEYSASGEVRGTYAQEHWCGGCTPTSSQLAIIRLIGPVLRVDTSTLTPFTTWTPISFLASCPASGVFDHCYGERVDASGNKYVGEWSNGKPDGNGTYTYASGDKYVGESMRGKFNGPGVFIRVNGDKSVGSWREGKRNLTIEYDASNTVTGHYSYGKLCSGCIPGGQVVPYVKSIDSGLPVTSSTLASALPPCPSGGPFNNCYGPYTFADGTKYVGEWRNGKRYGKGATTYASGDEDVGTWKDGKLDGKGTYTWANGTKYVGKWRDGKMHGGGIVTYASGDKYVGQFADGKPYEGITYDPSGLVTGAYSDGQLCDGCTPTDRQVAIVRGVELNIDR